MIEQDEDESLFSTAAFGQYGIVQLHLLAEAGSRPTMNDEDLGS